jgi:hypothetical protein
VNRIHREFNTAGDAALAEAQQIIAEAQSTNVGKSKSYLILGFLAAKEAKEHIQEE